jgi:hypothetical protein
VAILSRSRLALHAVGQSSLKRWRGLLELAEVGGMLFGVDARLQGHPPVPSLVDLHLDREMAQLHVVNPEAHIVLPFAGQSSDAVVFGPRVAHLDEASRERLLDESRRAVRPGGHVMLVVVAEEAGRWLWSARLEWQPGAPRGWWSDPVGDRFEEVRHASFSRRLGLVIATQSQAAVAH